MAIIQALASAQVEDSDTEITSHDQPIKFDSAVASIANLISWVQGWGIQVDGVSEGAIRKLRVCLLVPLPSGIKGTPTALGDNEETGLFTMIAAGTPNSYGVDVPDFLQSAFIGNKIDPANAAVISFLAYLETATFNVTPTDRYGNALTGVKTQVKTFRKHRRALRRA